MAKTTNHNIDVSGFTLIEALITLAVFTIGIIGAFSFALTNMSSVRDNFDRYLATNLAREGIEMVKNVRDSNWMKIDANEDCDATTVGFQPCTWDQNLAYGFYIVDYTPAYFTPFRLNTLNDINAESHYLDSTQRLYINGADNGFYSHTLTTTPTNMYRTMQLNTICLDPDSGAETVVYGPCAGPVNIQKIGVQVIAHLRWTRANKTSQLEISENLYNWRK